MFPIKVSYKYILLAPRTLCVSKLALDLIESILEYPVKSKSLEGFLGNDLNLYKCKDNFI